MNAELEARLVAAGIDPVNPFVREATTETDLPEHARWAVSRGQVLPALVFTWHGVDGIEVEQVNPYRPILNDDKTVSKYLWPAGQKPVLNVLEVNPEADTAIIVEGTKQTLAALRYAQPNWQVAGIGGCSNWTSDGVADPALIEIVNGRSVVIVFDADWRSNRAVWDAAKALGESALSFGATSVRWAVVPGRGTTGLDDMLGAIPDEQRRRELLGNIVSGATLKMGRQPAAKAAPASPFWGDKAPLTVTLAEDIFRNRALALGPGLVVYTYANGVFSPDAKHISGEIIARLEDHFRKSHVADVTEVLIKLLREAGTILPAYATEPLLNVTNGMLDLRTGELFPHDPTYLSSMQIPVAWDAAATCPTYESWVVSVTAAVDDLEESVSLMLDSSMTPTKAVFLYGPSRSGKSTYLRLLEHTIGKALTSSVTLADLSDNRFASADVHGKMLNVAADLSSHHLADMSTFKMLTGEDLIRAEHKYGQPFFFTNTALFAFSANNPPAVAETSNAYLERIKPFQFPRSFAGSEDPTIEAAMQTELSGFLVRLVAANQRFRARPGYQRTDPWVAADFAQHADRVRAWIAAETFAVESPEGTKGRDLFRAYKAWSVENNYGQLGVQAFYEKLTASGIEEFSKHSTDARYFRLKLREEGFGGAKRPTPSVQNTDPSVTPNPPHSNGSSPKTPTPATRSVESVVSKAPSLAMVNDFEDRGENSKSHIGEQGEGRTTDSTDMAIDFQTAAAEQAFAGHHEGPFLRLMSFDDGNGHRGTTSDPEKMRRLLVDAPRLVTHDGWRFDLPAAAHHLGLDAGELIGKSDDLIVASRLSRPPRDRQGRLDRYTLDHLAETHLGEQKLGDLRRLKRMHEGYDKIPVDDPDYVAYALKDADLTRRLAEIAAPLMTEPYYARERPIAQIAAGLTVKGLRVDTDLLTTRVAEQEARLTRVRSRLIGLGFPATASPGASDAGRARLLDLAGALQLTRTTTGKVSIASDDLLALTLPADHPLTEPVALLVELSAERPFVSTLADNLTPAGRVHPDHQISGVNGRWSTQRPNVMGVGKRSAALLADRDLILAEPGHVFVQCDLKGIDNRSVAGLSGDTAYAALLAPGMEINAELARLFYGDGIDYKKIKNKVKAIGHGINFGRGPRAIARDNGLELDEVKRVWDRYFESFPQLKEWQNRIREETRRGWSLDNGFGRRVRVEPGREYTEAPARQTASCTRDLAMTGLLRLRDDGLLPYLRMFIHDEVVLSVPEGEAELVLDRVVEAMSFDWSSPSGIVIPIIAEPSTTNGPRWTDVYREDGRKTSNRGH